MTAATELARLRSLHAAATSGPWVMDGGVIDGPKYADVLRPGTAPSRYSCCGEPVIEGSNVKNDLPLIAAMRNALPALLDVAEAARCALTVLTDHGPTLDEEHAEMRASYHEETVLALRAALAALGGGA